MTIQFVDFAPEGDKVRVSAHSNDIKKLGWKFSGSNIPSAYLVGYMAGKKALENGIEYAILDIGRKPPVAGSAVFAALKGMVDAGVDVPHGEEILPSEERISGEHIDKKVTTAFNKIKNKMEE